MSQASLDNTKIIQEAIMTRIIEENDGLSSVCFALFKGLFSDLVRLGLNLGFALFQLGVLSNGRK